MGLYAGLKAIDIRARKGLKPTQNILDFMGYTESAANWFRITQSEEKLSREGIKGKDEAQQIYLKVGERVRLAMNALGGIMPEDLPIPENSINQKAV
jgi:DNA-damage-inducible protein D